jgi:hypothetical protein
MSRILLVASFVFFAALCPCSAQHDSPASLAWANKQANRIDSILTNAIMGQDHLNILLKLSQVYTLFDAVTISGMYCAPLRAAAQAGRNEADIVNFRLEKDLNTVIIRATLARSFAEKMRMAVGTCAPAVDGRPEEEVFMPSKVIHDDAEIVMLDLTDGLAVGDAHILSQKLEHAIRVLFDIEHLASTLDSCTGVLASAQRAVTHCEAALAAQNSKQVDTAVQAAIQEVKYILAYQGCE